MSSEALATLAGKLLKELLDEACKIKPHVHGEWRGQLLYAEIRPGIYRVAQDVADPRRLWVPALGYEYAWRGGFESDGGSIPKALQTVPNLHLHPLDYPSAYFAHDYMYDTETIWVREPGGVWHEMNVDRAMADCILYIGLTADNATLADARLIFRAVRLAGQRAWNRCRRVPL